MNGAARFIDFLQRAFEAVELERSATKDGWLMHAEVRIGDSIVMLNDDYPEYCPGAPLAHVEDLTRDEIKRREAAAFPA